MRKYCFLLILLFPFALKSYSQKQDVKKMSYYQNKNSHMFYNDTISYLIQRFVKFCDERYPKEKFPIIYIQFIGDQFDADKQKILIQPIGLEDFASRLNNNKSGNNKGVIIKGDNIYGRISMLYIRSNDGTLIGSELYSRSILKSLCKDDNYLYEKMLKIFLLDPNSREYFMIGDLVDVLFSPKMVIECNRKGEVSSDKYFGRNTDGDTFQQFVSNF